MTPRKEQVTRHKINNIDQDGYNESIKNAKQSGSLHKDMLDGMSIHLKGRNAVQSGTTIAESI